MKKSLVNLFLAVTVLLLSDFAAAQLPRVATIQGQLLRSDGSPLSYTEIELVPTNSDHIINDSSLIGVSNISGKFSFFDVPPGEYTLSINFDDKPTKLSPFATYFYPGTAHRDEAQIFQISGSTKLRGLRFHLAPALTGRKIIGSVVWDNGSPVKGAMIGCRDLEYDRVISYGCASTDENGTFSLEGFIGRKYQIGAIVFERPLDKTSEPPHFVIAAGESDIFDLELSTKPLTIKVFRSKDVQKMVDKYLS